jgi:hypothetical protein
MSLDPSCRDDSDVFSVSEARLAELARHLQDRGMMRLAGGISPSWIATARGEVMAYVERHGPGDYDMLDLDDWECPTIRNFAVNPKVESLLSTLAASLSSRFEDPGAYTRRILRIHDGSGAVTSKPHVWHYDDNTMTLHVPLITPGGNTGHLGALPAQRRLHRTLIAAIQERIRNDEYPHPRAKEKFDKAPERYTVPLIPGEALFFVGHRTLHSPLPWPVGQLRANMILHYGHDTRPESRLLRAVRAMRDGVVVDRRARLHS